MRSRLLARIVAVFFVLLIIPSTACAFWLYNANRVALDRNTYNDVLQRPLVYNDLLMGLLEGFTKNQTVPRDAQAILHQIRPPDWGRFSDTILPQEEAKKLVNNTVTAFFDWIDFKSQTLNTGFDLSNIKARMNSPELQKSVADMIPMLPPCSPEQTAQLRSFTETSSFNEFAVCNPGPDDALVQTEKTGLIAGFGILASQFPDRWELADELMDVTAETDAGPLPLPPQASTAVRVHMNTMEFDQGRAYIRLQGHLLALLFLIPIAFLFLIVIVTIRSLKSFLRWTGWVVVIAGVVSLLPVVLLPAINSGFLESRVAISNGMGSGGQALTVFVAALIQALINQLTVSVLYQIAGMIVIGLILVFISVVLPHADDLSEEELKLLRQSAAGATP